ncbi:MAG: hypothetical protein ACT6RL_19035 [Neoaquamicrobium sediminum]|uniref:Uncharacterized protein n=1 Tax=Neoaquamicrobium sediminum TaxID=1849104 RepID=A0ABV3X029_9HYPH|nr:hypothetical protein [Mesorhizobium sediminum]NRC56598.1 hypothetical protein [Mesorhizobium sediminum]
MPITRADVISVLGPTDEVLVVELIASEASIEELREAWEWLNNEEALIGAGRPLPGPMVSRLIDILDDDDER